MTKRPRLNTEEADNNIPLRPQNVGIKGISLYVPRTCVSQESLEQHDGVSSGKYTIGLGQTNMVFVNDREDIYSMCLTAVNNLITRYNIDTDTIGRLEVGTETLLDKSKSIKSVLMQLFPNVDGDIEGVDTINACYGGTSALFNAINWITSEYCWDGRDAIVVCGDIAIYEKGPARPTGGAGVVAMWIGADAPLVMDRTRASYMEHVYDFFKPDLTSEYPVVQGHYSLTCYIKALDKAYANYKKKRNGTTTTLFDYNVFHVPTCKLVQKSFARMLYNDWLQDETLFPDVDPTLRELTYEESLLDKRIEKTFMKLGQDLFNQRVKSSLQLPTNTGNMYTASVFASLCSLIYEQGKDDSLLDKTIGMFSYGSGMAASLYSFTVRDNLNDLIAGLKLDSWYSNRVVLTPGDYESYLQQRENIHLQKDYAPVGTTEHIVPGSFYLHAIDSIFRREYKVKE